MFYVVVLLLYNYCDCEVTIFKTWAGGPVCEGLSGAG